MFGFAHRTRRRVHICTMATDQMPYYAPLARWLRRHGYRLLTKQTASASQKLAAARMCDLCLLLLGPTPGPGLAGSTFTQTEMEVSVAQDLDPSKLLVFAQESSAHPATAEQADFIERLRNFTDGTYQATCTSPTDFLAQVVASLPVWHSSAARSGRRATVHPARAIMISSTGDLVAERQMARRVLQRHRLPVIDYQIAASEAVVPLERVTSWACTCRALVLILGPRYGYISPRDGLGVTELEFVTALAHQRPMLVFFRHDALTTDDSDQQQFVARVRQFVPVEQQFVCDDPASFERQLTTALKRLASLKPAPLPRVSVEQARQWYQCHLQRWLGRLSVPGHAKTLPLTTMILTLTSTSLDPTAIPIPDAFESVFIPDYPPDLPTMAPEEALAHSGRLLLVGGPGSGKSTVLSWFALQASQTSVAQEPMLPVYISLPVYARARLSNEVDSLAAFVAREERRLLFAADPTRSQWCAALEAGQGVLLLDALDGVPGAATAQVLADIAAYAAQLPERTHVVVAGRGDSAALLDAGFTRFDMVPLGAGQQQILIEDWIRAHAPQALSLNEMRRRVTRILFQLRFVSTETQWARTPLLLGLFTAVSDSAAEDERPILTPLAGEAVFRRALRALLQSVAPAHLEAKEAFLRALASQLTDGASTAPITSDALAHAWEAVPATSKAGLDRDMLLDELCTANKLLVRQGTTYTYAADNFWSHFVAQHLCIAPERDRLDLVVRRRLSARWGAIVSALTAELDRLGRQHEATRVLETLTRADQAPLFGAAGGDPLHTSALKVTYAQGARIEPYRTAEPGPTLARIWQEVWRSDRFGMRRYAVKGLYVLGPAAALALDTLREAASDQSGQDPSRVTFALFALRRLAFYGNQTAKEVLALGEGSPTPATANNDVRLLDAPLDLVRRALAAPEIKDRAAAAMQVRKFGRLAQDCVPALIPLLEEGNSFVVMQAASALRSMGTAAAPAAVALAHAALRDEVSLAADDVCSALHVLGALAAPAVPIISAALHAADTRQRDAAISAAGALGLLMAQEGATIMALTMQDYAVSWRAKSTLSALHVDTTPLIRSLRERLRSADVRTQREALVAITHLGELCVPLLDDVLALANPAQPTIYEYALSALVNLKADAATTLRVLRLALTLPAHQQGALRAIGMMGALALPLANDLMPLLDQGPLCQPTLEAFVQMSAPATPERMMRIIAHLNDADELTRLSAFGAACGLHPLLPETVRAVVETLDARQRQADSAAWRYFLQLVDPLQHIVDAGVPAGILPN